MLRHRHRRYLLVHCGCLIPSIDYYRNLHHRLHQNGGQTDGAGLQCTGNAERNGAQVRFVKSGAAPSFVVRDGRLFRLASKTVPIGILRALDAEMIRFTVEPGDTVVMLSDGVMAGFDEAPWLCDLLATPTIMALSPKEIAERIVAAAATESRDDITAAVIKVV